MTKHHSYGVWTFITDAPEEFIDRLYFEQKEIFDTLHSPLFHEIIIRGFFSIKEYKFIPILYNSKPIKREDQL